MPSTHQGLTLGEELGSGALARVVRVHTETGRDLAGKILHTSRESDDGAAGRFAREAQVIAGLQHRNVVQIHGLTTLEGRDVLLMELVVGPTLADVIARDAPLPTARLRSIAQGIAAGLAAAHDRGVIHRDLKPANILLAAGDVPKIADFGMARASSFAGMDPGAFTVLGTPDYMAPESLDPLAVDGRSDLYALGCIMFEMATGRPPFGGATAFGLLEQHRTAPVPPLEHQPPELTALVQRLLAKSPGDRPYSASAVAAELASEHGGGALALPSVSSASLVTGGKCARCGAGLVEALGVCLSCKLAQPRIERGPYTLFVCGPGQVADKFDVMLRERLLAWLHGNPSLGLDPAPLQRRIPRVPFVFATGISEGSGQAVMVSLHQLGIESELRRGGRLALSAMRKKAGTLAGRALAIMGASTAMMAAQHNATFLVMVGGAVTIPLVAGGWTLRSATRLRKSTPSALPEAIRERLRRVAQVGTQLEAQRHREALRGVVAQALALRSLHETQDERTDAELAQALDVAMVAAARLDVLDTELEQADLRESSAHIHALMRERDTWSSRLLDLAATLESLRIRVATAVARRGRADDVELLELLRAKVEALEEVQA